MWNDLRVNSFCDHRFEVEKKIKCLMTSLAVRLLRNWTNNTDKQIHKKTSSNLYAYLTIIWEFSGICNSEMGWLQFAPLGKSLMFSSFAMVQRCNTTIILQKNASEILEWVFLALMTAATAVVWIELIIEAFLCRPVIFLSVALIKNLAS